MTPLPEPPKVPAGGDGVDPPDTDLAAWRRIQDSLPFDANGDVLKPPEVRFVRRFLRRGEHLTWIPSSENMEPTNDFIWHRPDGDVIAELKSTKARWKTIRGRVEDAVIRALNHEKSTIKDRFIIDIGNEPLPDALRDELASYNVGRLRYRIAQLWVLSGDGTDFNEIALREK